MSEVDDDIQGLLAEILGDDSPAVKKPQAKGPPMKGGVPPFMGGTPPEVKEAIRDIANETFDPELFEMSDKLQKEEALSPTQARKAAKAVRKQAETKFADVLSKAGPGTVGKPGIPDEAFHEWSASLDKAAELELAPVREMLPKPPKKGAAVTQGVTKAPPKKGTGKKASAQAASGQHADDAREKELAALSIPMPKFTSKDLASTMDIRNFATLVKLETARWHAKAKDRGAAADVAKANNADETAFNVQKNLLAGADEALRRIHKALDEARAKHYEMTLPWTTKKIDDTGRRTGSRLLPNSLFFEYTTEMARCKKEMNDALDAFVPAYPGLIQAAKGKLGTRFNPAEYPNASDITRHFSLSFDFEPIPKGDDFKGLPDQQIEALARTINRKTQEMMEGAMQDVWTRLYTAISHMSERLSSPDKAFHYTMVDNVREVTRLLKHLNVTQDANVEKIRKMLDKFITPHDAKELRENNDLRIKVHGYAQSIVDAMNKMGGAKKS